MLFASGCQAAEPTASPVEVVGRLEDKKILEASGLARSQRQDGLLWTVNDHGAQNIVHGLSHTGERQNH